MICQVCGLHFKSGKNPITGVPNGVGMKFEETGDKIFDVCSFCMMYRYNEVIAKVDEFKKEG